VNARGYVFPKKAHHRTDEDRRDHHRKRCKEPRFDQELEHEPAPSAAQHLAYPDLFRPLQGLRCSQVNEIHRRQDKNKERYPRQPI